MTFENYTPGPWQWSDGFGAGPCLETPHSGRLIVMDFVRHGMQKARPRFSDREGERRGGIMHKAGYPDLALHPDARLIAAAPMLLHDRAKLLSALDEALMVLDRTPPGWVDWGEEFEQWATELRACLEAAVLDPV